MKYEIKNGILHADGKPVFALGASYYPSFHYAKYQVPPEGDRIGEMKIDLAKMRDFGLNWFRTAALADIALENGEVRVESDFIDAMCREAETAELAASVRLNGYFVNLSGNEDYEFINHRNEAMEKRWSAFMVSSLHHEGATADSLAATAALAKHYDSFPAVVSYQIFNEPHYPGNGVFDYHPDTIAAYRKWLTANGIMSEEAARDYEPPRERPKTKDGISEWVNWRRFSTEALLNYLDLHGKIARETAPGKDTYTCYTTAPMRNDTANSGVTYFDDSAHLTTQAITQYTPFDGADYFTAALEMTMAECAAAVSGRRAWIAELDKRTHMPASKFIRETVSAIGHGYKGINYYEWRGDFAAEGTPLPDNCGFLFNDGTPTASFASDGRMIALINRHSEEIVTAEKVRQSAAILHSDNAYRYADALSDPQIGGRNAWVHDLLETFRELKTCGIAPEVVRACDLAENRLGTKLLLVPSLAGLSDAEKSALSAFEAAGGSVWYMAHLVGFGSVSIGGWWNLSDRPKNRTTSEFRGGVEMADVLEACGIKPLIGIADRNLFAHVLDLAGGGRLLALVSNKPNERPIASQRITLGFAAKSARFCTTEGEWELPVEDGGVTLPEFSDGALVFVH